jgi:SP family myo-inositol transporter-like MFS transporter 13
MTLLLTVSGLGGLLYGIDVGIIAGALPYLEATSGLTANQLSVVVAAVLLGSVFSTLFAGMFADWMGRKRLMACSGLLFILSIPLIALAQGYGPLVVGRLLQGMSAGLIGVVVPLYLAECLGASNRGKGTGMFQWLLTLGIVAAALIGLYFSFRVEEVAKLHDAEKLLAFKDSAWRLIFWVSLPPGILFVIGTLFVAESPRWLCRKGRREEALAALLRSRSQQQAEVELGEMEAILAAEKAQADSGGKSHRESLLSRKYTVPFVLACVILACNQATGVNSIIGYNATILIQSGLSDKQAHLGYAVLTVVNFLMTMIGVMLVDRKGRKFLLSLGSAGIIVSLVAVGLAFRQTERQRVDCAGAIQALVTADQKATFTFSEADAARWLADQGAAGEALRGKSKTLSVIYSYGDFRAASKVLRSTDEGAKLELDRGSCVPPNKVVAFFANPFADLAAARIAPLKIENALLTPIPSEKSGALTALFIFCFMAFFAVGPGVCVWLALSELMPTRIRSNGMSVALLLNQAVSTTIAAVFLPVVGKYGYGTMFFAFAACTVAYFVTAAFFLPETKGKTLEEIEAHFERKR